MVSSHPGRHIGSETLMSTPRPVGRYIRAILICIDHHARLTCNILLQCTYRAYRTVLYQFMLSTDISSPSRTLFMSAFYWNFPPGQYFVILKPCSPTCWGEILLLKIKTDPLSNHYTRSHKKASKNKTLSLCPTPLKNKAGCKPMW